MEFKVEWQLKKAETKWDKGRNDRVKTYNSTAKE